MASLLPRTKIICTLGPSTDTADVSRKMIEGAMSVARINTAHGDPQEHSRRIQQVRTLAAGVGKTIAVLVDLPGPKFRVGKIAGDCMELRPGSEVALGAGAKGLAIPVSNSEILGDLRSGQSVYLADGSVQLLVEEIRRDHALCTVLIGGIIRSGSGLNFPESDLSAMIPTEADIRQLAFAIEQKADWIGISFVRKADEIDRVRSYLPAQEHPLLMAKIEKRQALTELRAIVDAADGVMVARGDLGVETDLAQVPLVQKRIVALANERARPVIIATQMLESMVEHARPTRAEVADVANAVLDGTDGVMLSAETAIGQFPIESLEMLRRVIAATEAEYPYGMALGRFSKHLSTSPEEAVAFAACRLSSEIHAKAIVVPVRSIHGAIQIARFRPKAPILAVADSEILSRQLMAIWGVIPMLAPTIANTGPCIAQAKEWLFRHKLVTSGDPVVVLSASSPSRDFSDRLQIVQC